MKKLLTCIIAFVMLLVFTSSAFAQKRNAFKVNIFSPLVKSVSVFYERALSDGASAQLGFFYTGFKVTDTKFSGFGITPEFRLYPGKNPDLKGFYLGPFIRYQSFSLETPSIDMNMQEYTAEASFSSFGGGLLIGGQFLFGDVVTLDIFIGPSYNSGTVKVDVGTEDDFSLGSFDGFGVRGGVTVGIAF
ncbi:MAG: DUF3575 domain-containing protein [Bacteroidales bacterium]|nr:MAG: DUF3575 domain-containing protein [Bacteroidales bacterium]